MKGRKTPIVAVNPSGTLAGYFESQADAKSRLNLSVASLHRSLTEGTIYKGVKWMYEEEFRELWMFNREALKYNLDPRVDRFTGRLRKGCKYPYVNPISAKHKAALIENVRKAWVRHSRSVICVKDGAVYRSISEAARHYGVSSTAVWISVTKGRFLKKLGTTFKYYENKNDD